MEVREERKAFRARAKGVFGVTAYTPRGAAERFFREFQNKRKCTVIEGVTDGVTFTVIYSNICPPPREWRDVTKKQAAQLPEA